MNHNCNFFLHLRVSWCAYSDVLIEWRFLYKYHTYNVYVLHELSGCASSDFLIKWRIFHKNRICNSFVLHELSWCAYSDFRLVSIWIVNSWVWPKILLFKNFDFPMNNSYVFVFGLIGWKFLVAIFTCEFFRWIHFNIQKMTVKIVSWSFTFQLMLFSEAFYLQSN